MSDTFRARVCVSGKPEGRHLLAASVTGSAKREARGFVTDIPTRGAVELDRLTDDGWRPVARYPVDGLTEGPWADVEVL